MPLRDGTGPSGSGPGTGRGRGWRRPFSFMQPGRIGFLSALIPIAAAALRDLANPNGLLRSAGRKFIARKPDNLRKPVDASFSILDETKSNGKRTK